MRDAYNITNMTKLKLMSIITNMHFEYLSSRILNLSFFVSCELCQEEVHKFSGEMSSNLGEVHIKIYVTLVFTF